MNRLREEVLKNLKDLNYFNHSKDINEAINRTFENYNDDGIINFPTDLINRLFYLDAESNFESEGLKDTLEDFIELLNKLGLKLELKEYSETFDNKIGSYIFRKAKINANDYLVQEISNWEESFLLTIKILNEILDDNKIEERVYGLFMDESSTLILLTKKQFEFLSELIPFNSEFRPVDLLIGDKNPKKETSDSKLDIENTNNKVLISLLDKIKSEKIKKLNLTEFELKYLPPDVLEMEWLEELILGPLHFKFNSFIFDHTNPCTLLALPKELSKLKNLRKLILGGGIDGCEKTKIIDYSPIWGLENLEVLGLSSTSIDNISGIENLKKLITLNIDFNDRNVDFSIISNLPNLETLQLEKVGLTSVDFLQDLKNLKTLSIGSNKINTLNHLNNHTQIMKICCCCNNIKDDTFLPNCKNLKYVCIGNSFMEKIILKTHTKVHLNK